MTQVVRTHLVHIAPVANGSSRVGMCSLIHSLTHSLTSLRRMYLNDRSYVPTNTTGYYKEETMSSDDHALAVDEGNHSKSFNNSNKFYDLQIVLTQEEFNVLGNSLTHSLTHSLIYSLTHSLTYLLT